jgi:CRISPR type III-B/RAMP module RAMP protein Cmr6
MATTRLLAPSDLPSPELAVVGEESCPSAPDTMKDFNAPNAGLLWQRYLPAHDTKKLSDEFRSPAGADFTQDVEDVEARVSRERDPVRAGNVRKKGRQDIKSRASTWAGVGVISWFTEVANSGVHDGQSNAHSPSSPKFANKIAGLDRLIVSGQKKISAFSDLVKELNARREKALSSAIILRVKSAGRISIGSGNPATIENSGLAFHHTYGFPILPGSSLKGLARHFFLEEYTDCAELRMPDGLSHDRADRIIFGASDDPAVLGAVYFEDGWPLLPDSGHSWYSVDVITPHHPDYYGGSAPVANDEETPDIIHFLCLDKDVRFDIPVGLTSQAAKLDYGMRGEILHFAAALLTSAVETWGIGSRTGAGLGRFIEFSESV